MPRSLDDLDDDDLSLPQRSRRPDPREEITREMSHDADREFTLSTGTVLVLFFTLAAICAVFFGFGYSMGHKSTKAAETANVVPPDPVSQPDEGEGKPAAGAPVQPTIPSYQADAPSTPRATPAVKTTSSADGTRVTITTPNASATAPPKPAAVPETKRPAGGETASTPPAAQPIPAAVSPAQTTAGDPNAVYVQIAAVSHQEDANVLLSALKRRGYSVFTRSNPGDKLIHVQVGPYSGKKDAEAMRQRLQGDGYNAILK